MVYSLSQAVAVGDVGSLVAGQAEISNHEHLSVCKFEAWPSPAELVCSLRVRVQCEGFTETTNRWTMNLLKLIWLRI